jgi:peptide/nickel transport system substrate-binding protein
MTQSQARGGAFSAAAVLCAFASACVALTACSTSENPGASRGGSVVRVAINSEPNSLNPVLETTLQESYVEEAIFNGLVKFDGSGKLIPDLAVEVPSQQNHGISADGRAITYHLRHGVVWQDGAPFTAADVAFTFAAIMDPKTNDVYQAYYGRIKRLETPDPYTVVVHLDRPFAEVLSDFFGCNTSLGILPKHLYAASRDINHDYHNDHPVGTGPYRLERWDHGSLLVLKANPRYFGGAPKIGELDIYIVPNQNTLMAMIAAHDLDVGTQVSPTELPRLRGIPEVRTILAPTYVERFVSFNVTHAPFDDRRVRTALAMALDRRRIADTAFAGTAIPADSILPPYSWAYVAGAGAPRYDPASAKRLLDATGWIAGTDGVRRKDGKPLAFNLINQSESAPLANLAVEVQAQWRDIGVEASVRQVPRNVLFGNPGLETDGKFDVAIDNSATDSDPDRSVYIESSAIAPRGFNFERYADPDVDRWSEDALMSYDRKQRAPYYAAIARRLNRDLPYVPIAWERWVYAVNSSLKNFQAEPIGSDLWNVQDWSY